MKKHSVLSILLVGTMLLIAACSGNGSESATTEAVSEELDSIEVLELEEEEPTPEEESVPAADEEPAAEESNDEQAESTGDILAAVSIILDQPVIWEDSFDNLNQIEHWYLEGDFQLENGILTFSQADFRPITANEAVAYYAAQAGYEGWSQAVHITFSYSGSRQFKVGASYKGTDSYEDFSGGGATDEFMVIMQPSSNIPNPNPYLTVTTEDSNYTPPEVPMEGNTFLEENKNYEMVFAVDNQRQEIIVVIWEPGNYEAGLYTRMQGDEKLTEMTSSSKPWGFSIYQWGGGNTLYIDQVQYIAFDGSILP